MLRGSSLGVLTSIVWEDFQLVPAQPLPDLSRSYSSGMRLGPVHLGETRQVILFHTQSEEPQLRSSLPSFQVFQSRDFFLKVLIDHHKKHGSSLLNQPIQGFTFP